MFVVDLHSPVYTAPDATNYSVPVGNAVEFPFTFMRSTVENSTVGPINGRESDTAQARPLSEVDPLDKIETKESTQSDEQPSLSTVLSQPKLETRQVPVPSSSPVTTRQWSSIRKRQSPTVTELQTEDADKRRSLSLTSIDDLKMSKRSPTRVPLFTRLGRSWSRRMSAA